MKFVMSAVSDIGISRPTNQDSICGYRAKWNGNDIAMAIVCDGMGGYAKGELASAVVVRSFAEWFEKELPRMTEPDMFVIGRAWCERLHMLNEKISAYGKRTGMLMGTTFTGIFFTGQEYVMVHAGDSRAYEIEDSVIQLSTDHSYVAREVAAGRMTEEEASVSRKRNILLQCVGNSKKLQPQVRNGRIKKNAVYVVCSDGFWHKADWQEMHMMAGGTKSGEKLQRELQKYVQKIIERQEKDNISVLVVSTLKD